MTRQPFLNRKFKKTVQIQGKKFLSDSNQQEYEKGICTMRTYNWWMDSKNMTSGCWKSMKCAGQSITISKFYLNTRNQKHLSSLFELKVFAKAFYFLHGLTTMMEPLGSHLPFCHAFALATSPGESQSQGLNWEMHLLMWNSPFERKWKAGGFY